MKLNKNELIIEGKCLRYTHDGKGIVNYEGIPLYVEGLLLGETGRIVVDKINDSYGFGTLKQLLQRHPGRVTPACPYYQECGGCQVQHMSYATQLDLKQHRVELLFKKEGFQKVPFLPIVGMDQPTHYRNKSLIPFGILRQQSIIAGYYALGTHRIINMDQCLLDHPETDAIILTIKSLIKELGIHLYDAISKQSFLTHVLIRQGIRSNQTMVVLITTIPRFPRIKELLPKLLVAHPWITTVIHQIKRNNHDEQADGKEFILHGKGWIEETLGGLRFKITARSFFQINTLQTEKLYELALQFAQLKRDDKVLDAYCGVGTIGLLASRQAGQVTGVEIIPEAIENAKQNAYLNHIKNTRFYAEDATDFIRRQVEKGNLFDVVFVDPPRLGLTPAFVHALQQMQPDRIVYISCDPSTLVRDLALLKDFYEIKKVQSLDMFAQTFHVETCVLLSLK